MKEHLRVLFVEDDQVDQMAFKRFVKRKKLPYDYEICGSVAEAKKALSAERFDIVLTDHSLGDGTAFDLFDEVGDTPLVFITGSGNEEIAVKAMNFGAVDYLIKDPDSNYFVTLPNIISSALEHKRTEDELIRYREHLEELVNERTDELSKANNALKQSEENFRLLAENSIDCIWVLDTKLRFTYVSPSMERILGYKPKQMVGTKISSYFKKKEFLKVGALAAKAITNYKTFTQITFETKTLNSKNEEVDIEISSKVLLNSQGKLLGLQGVTRDITERVQAEKTLQESEEKYRTLFDSSKDAIMIEIADAGFINGNPAAVEMFGCRDLEEFISQTPATLSPEYQPDGALSAEKVKQYIAVAMKESSYFFEWVHKRMDGHEFPATVLLTSMELQGRKMFQATVRDITERVRAEGTLRESEENFRLLAENSIDCIWVLDTKLRFTYLSPSVEGILGYKPKQVVGTKLSSYFKKKEFLKVSALAAKAITNYKTFTQVIFETKMLNSKNEEVDIEISSKVLLNSQGKLIGLQGTTKDITERKQAEEKEQLHSQNIAFLSKTAMQFVDFPPQEDIYRFISEKLTELSGESIVVVNSIDQAKGILTTRAVAGMGKYTKDIMKLVGRNPKGIEYDANDEGLAYLADGKLHDYTKGLYGIFLRTVPKPACHAIEKLYRLNKIYTVGFVQNERLFGNAAIFLPQGIELENAETIKLFVEQASIAIQRMQAVQALNQEKEKAQKYLDIAEVMIIALNKEGEITLVNQKGASILGYQIEELTGKNWFDTCVPTADRVQAKKIFNEFIDGEEGWGDHWKQTVITKSGEERIIDWHSTPLWEWDDEDKHRFGSLSSGEDITGRVQAQQEKDLLLNLSRQASAETSLDDLLFFIANQIVEIIPRAEASSIFLYDEERKVSSIRAWAGYNDSDVKGIEFEVDGNQVGRIFRTKKPACINNVSEDPDFKLIDKPSTNNIVSQIAVPLIYKEHVVGIVYADNLTRTDAFSQKNLDFLESIGNQLAGMIENARLLEYVRQSEEQYHSVVEDSPGLIDRFTPDGTITFVNQEYGRFFGKKHDELIGTNIQSAIPEEERESVMLNLASLTEESPMQTIENKVIRHDGEIRWMRWVDRALFNDKGQMINIQSFGQDITRMIEAEEALKQEQEKAQKYLDIAGVALVALNTKGEITLINQKGCQILGYEEDELIGRNWFDTCLPERHIKEVKGVFRKIIKGEVDLVEYYENPILTKSGQERIIAWYNTVLRNEKEHIIGLLSSGEDITERKRAEQLLNALNQAAVAMGTAQTHEEIFSVIAEELKQVDISCVLLPLDEAQGELIVKYVSFESALLDMAERLTGVDYQDFSFPVDAVDMFRKVIKEKKALFRDKSEQILRQILPRSIKKFSAQITKIIHAQTSITTPLIDEDKVIGVFSVQSDNLTQEDTPIITAFADQLSSAWNKIGLLQDLRKTVEGTIHTIAATVEARDPYTAGHQTRVADLAASIAREMKLTSEQIEGVRMAGIVHDLGKINIPAEILSKPGKISELEYKIIQTHPQVGFDLLKEIEFPWPIAEMVLQHHEKIDGSGYPQGLKSDEILLEARILAVADVVEAMSSHRPYRPALGIEKALKQIREDKGTLLDPKVVDACLKLFEQGYKLPEG